MYARCENAAVYLFRPPERLAGAITLLGLVIPITIMCAEDQAPCCHREQFSLVHARFWTQI